METNSEGDLNQILTDELVILSQSSIQLNMTNMIPSQVPGIPNPTITHQNLTEDELRARRWEARRRQRQRRAERRRQARAPQQQQRNQQRQERLDYGRTMFIHFTYCSSMKTFPRKFHALWDKYFGESPINEVLPVLGTRNVKNLQRQLTYTR
ncbi:unnamed protein product [Rotaria sordida]|uniref:Uncharacterized protein n=2 Tax=Rotaria sordida TaxID=392033 RepID=A0A814U489_9BILA|nr:unnamed protein product [Rotaria sordida]